LDTGECRPRDLKIHSCKQIFVEGGREKKHALGVRFVQLADFGELAHGVFVCDSCSLLAYNNN